MLKVKNTLKQEMEPDNKRASSKGIWLEHQYQSVVSCQNKIKYHKMLISGVLAEPIWNNASCHLSFLGLCISQLFTTVMKYIGQAT